MDICAAPRVHTAMNIRESLIFWTVKKHNSWTGERYANSAGGRTSKDIMMNSTCSAKRMHAETNTLMILIRDSQSTTVRKDNCVRISHVCGDMLQACVQQRVKENSECEAWAID